MEKKSLTLSMRTESHAESNKNSETHLHTMVYLSKKFSVITEILLRQCFFLSRDQKNEQTGLLNENNGFLFLYI